MADLLRYNNVYEGEMRLVAPGLGNSSWLDIDVPRSFLAVSYHRDKIVGADLQYTDDGELSTLFTDDYARVGYGPDGAITVEQCLQGVNAAPLGEHEKPIIDKNICIVSEKKAVAWVRVVSTGEPKPFGHPTLTLRVIVWKKG